MVRFPNKSSADWNLSKRHKKKNKLPDGAGVPTNTPPVTPAPPQVPPTEPPNGATAAQTSIVKRVAWRITATYVWLEFVLYVFGGAHFSDALNSFLFLRIKGGFEVVGLSPVGIARLGTVIKAGWILVITGFSPMQLLALFFYLLAFPVWLPILLIYRHTILESQRAQRAPQPGLRPSTSHKPAVSILGSSLLAWYVLFGDSSARKPLWTAVALSGAILLLLAYRAYRSVVPLTDSDTAPLPRLEAMALATVLQVKKLSEDAKQKMPTRTEAAGHRRTYGFYRYFFLNLAVATRGKSGKNLISSLLIFYYALSLIFLAFSAILFWAFVTRAVSPPGFQFSDCLLLSTSHFLPGITSPPVSFSLPFWVALGPGITAWLLLGVYVAASASLLPSKQEVYAQRAKTTYLCLRKAAMSIKLVLRLMNRILG